MVYPVRQGAHVLRPRLRGDGAPAGGDRALESGSGGLRHARRNSSRGGRRGGGARWGLARGPASPPRPAPDPEALGPVLDALKVSADGVGSWAPPALTGERDLLIPAAGLEVLKSLAPDINRLARLGDESRIPGFCPPPP